MFSHIPANYIIPSDLYGSFVTSFIDTNRSHSLVIVQDESSPYFDYNFDLVSKYPLNVYSVSSFLSLARSSTSFSDFSFLFLPDNCFLRPDFILRSLSQYYSSLGDSSSSVYPYVFVSPCEVLDLEGNSYDTEYSPIFDSDRYQLNHFTYLPFHVYLDANTTELVHDQFATNLSFDDLFLFFCHRFYDPKSICTYFSSLVPLGLLSCKNPAEIFDSKITSRRMCSNVRSNYTILSDKLATDTPLYESFLSSLPAVRTRARNISAIVCYRDKPEFTFTCISKLRQFNPDIVIIAVDHNSTPCPLLKRAEECADHTIQYDGPYNYSLMNNLGILFS